MSDLRIFTENVESTAIEQINTLIAQPAFADCKVRIMPDVHAGAGCVIGFTADLGDKVIPNIVGVDIGCGMLTVELGNIDIDFAKLDNIIRENIPFSREVQPSRIFKFDDIQTLTCYRDLKDSCRQERAIGSLGGGNHFIEIDVDEDNNKYLIIHTGSRNLGKQVAEYHQKLAIGIHQGKGGLLEKQAQIITEYKAQGRKSEIEDAIKQLRREFKAKKLDIPAELCYLTDKYRLDYLHDMKICQDFAVINRKMIAKIIMDKMKWAETSRFETVHNYIDHDSNIVRKGAISAKLGERVLIPMNMRDGCIIGTGKGNEDWNCSAPHGAGRVMSRGEARKNLDMDEFRKSMSGIYTTSVNESTIDESPMAYKPADEIIQNIRDTVDVERIIHPVYNFKAND